MLAAKMVGQKVAEALQLGIEYDPHPPFDTSSPDKVSPEMRDALKARMVAAFEKV